MTTVEPRGETPMAEKTSWNTRVEFRAIAEQEVIAGSAAEAASLAEMCVFNRSFTKGVEVIRCAVAPYPNPTNV